MAAVKSKTPGKADKIDVSICIATYNRLELLGDTIQSVLDQRNVLGLSYQIVVSDNHPSGNAEPFVAAIAAKTDIPIRYHQNTTRNFSNAFKPNHSKNFQN